jgi:hypothetical protein
MMFKGKLLYPDVVAGHNPYWFKGFPLLFARAIS